MDTHTQAKAEEDLVAALAKASGLQEELARTSQLLVDGALVRRVHQTRKFGIVAAAMALHVASGNGQRRALQRCTTLAVATADTNYIINMRSSFNCCFAQ